MKFITLLIKPASSKCQMHCKYCFYLDECDNRNISDCGIMSLETTHHLIEKVLNQFNEQSLITFSFQGGEPTIASLNWFQIFVNEVNQLKKDYHNIHYTIQTNGLLLDDKWIDFFCTNNFLIGISIDGPIHDKIRIDSNHNPTLNKIIYNLQKLQIAKLDYNILTVLSKELALMPKELYQFYVKHNIDIIQIIPCLPGLDKKENQYSLTPELYASFYKYLFDLWLEEIYDGHYRSFNLIDNIINLFNGINPNQCGLLGYCLPQLIIEADGNVYPCDFYALDKYKIGNINYNSLKEIVTNKININFRNEKRRSFTDCFICKYKTICNGGCKRQNICYFTDSYCGHQDILSYIESKIDDNFYFHLKKAIENSYK